MTDQERAAAGLTHRRRTLLQDNRARAATAVLGNRDIVRVWERREVRALRDRLGDESLAVWAEGDVLHILWRHETAEPVALGGVQPQLWPVEGAPDLWEASLLIRSLDRAVISIDVSGEHVTWRGQNAPRPLPRASPLSGALVRHELPLLRERRGVTTYRPPGFPGWLPGCVLADGAAITSYATLLEPAILAGAVPPVVLIGIDSGGSQQEYMPIDDPERFATHLSFVADRVLPWAVRTAGAAGPWLTAGFSNGAVWALAAARRRPEAFAGAIALSPSLVVNGIGSGRYYIAAGTLETGFRDSARRQAAQFRAAGVDVLHEEWIGGHDSYWWEQTMITGLAHLLR